MFDGNIFETTAHAQPRQQNRLSFEEMGTELLDAMDGTLVCLDNRHIIVHVSKTVKYYYGFEPTELIGLSILLIVEDSERDAFLKFLNQSSQFDDVCCVRIMVNTTNEYRQVKIHRKKKRIHDTGDVHSTTLRYSGPIETILILTLEESAYIALTLYDIHKQEFYTKMNLLGELTFEDHRGALITGYLPHEIFSQSIFNFVYDEDRLVKLHALWKCVTTGSSKLQWRFNARDGSVIFLQTEYKLISDEQNHDTIVARNEVLSPVQISQFDELQAAWRYQCKADIKGNSGSFKRISSSDDNSSSASNDECRISVPSLNMCFTTNKLQPLNLQGNIFETSKFARPLTLQDYITILMDSDKNMDGELVHMINNIQSLTSRYRRLNELEKLRENYSDRTMDDKTQSESLSPLIDMSSRQKQDCDSIVRGILSNSMKYNHENQSGDSTTKPFDGNGQNNETRSSAATSSSSSPSHFQIDQVKSNTTPVNPKSAQQHIEFLKKYKSAKTTLESQLESIRNQETVSSSQINDIDRRNVILHKLAQLENIKNKHLARRHDVKRHSSKPTTTLLVNNVEPNDFLNSLFSSSSPNSTGSISSDPMNNSRITSSASLSSSTNDQHQRNSSHPFDPGQTSLFNDLLTPPSSSHMPVNNTPSSYMNISFQDSRNDSTSSSSFPDCHYNTPYHY